MLVKITITKQNKILSISISKIARLEATRGNMADPSKVCISHFSGGKQSQLVWFSLHTHRIGALLVATPICLLGTGRGCYYSTIDLFTSESPIWTHMGDDDDDEVVNCAGCSERGRRGAVLAKGGNENMGVGGGPQLRVAEAKTR